MRSSIESIVSQAACGFGIDDLIDTFCRMVSLCETTICKFVCVEKVNFMHAVRKGMKPLLNHT